MVAKISHGTSLYGALSYNHEKVFQGTAEILSGHRMISDRPGLPCEAVDAAGRRDSAFDFSAVLARFLNEALLVRTAGEDGRDAGD